MDYKTIIKFKIMKSFVFILLMTGSLCCSCNAQQKNMMELGEKLSDSLEFKKSSFVMSSSAQIEPSYIIVVDGIQYVVCIDSKNIIKYIETKDKAFITPDGVKIGMDFSFVEKITNRAPTIERGWAYILPLPSGWNAAFDLSKEDYNKISSDSTVKWIFKRK